MDFEKAKLLIDNAQTICLVAHKKPDGDAVGCVGAMYHFLKELGKDVYMVMPDVTPRFSFLPEMDKVVSRFPESKELDLLICLDCSEIERRSSIAKEDLERADKILVIDHHMNSSEEGDLRIIDSEAPANAEIVYKLIKHINPIISKNVATYLYVGIMTDTGSFNYERTTGDTYRVAAELVDTGVEFSKICKKINDTYSEAKMKLIAKVIANMETYKEGKIRVSVLDKEEQEELNATEEDVDGLVTYLRCIEGTIAAVYIRWTKEGEYKYSIRAEEPIDASEVAKAFNGGGHKRAAGFETTNLKDTKEKLIQMLEGLL